MCRVFAGHEEQYECNCEGIIVAPCPPLACFFLPIQHLILEGLSLPAQPCAIDIFMVDISEGPVQMTHFLSRFKPGLVLTVDRGELPPLPLVSWVTLSGWKERWQRTLGGVKAIYTLARCRKFVPGFSLPAFKADTLLLYEEVCQAIAADDKTLLRQVLPQLTLPFSLVPNPQTAIMHAS